MITVRLDPELDAAVRQAALERGLTTSEFVRLCLTNHLQNAPRPSAWELGKDVFGKHASERTDLAREAKRLVRDKIHARSSDH